VGLLVQKKGKVRMGLCALHRKRRAVNILAGYSTLLLFAASVAWSVEISSAWPGLIGALVMIAGIIWAVRATELFAPVKIDATHIHLKGACRAFLAECPDWPG
jgi:hypothetical protein